MITGEKPNIHCTVVFEEDEWKVLYAYVNKDPIPPDKAPTLIEAVNKVTGPGGFLGRKSDGHPGTKTLYRGFTRLMDITPNYKIVMNMLAPYLPNSPPVFSNR